MAPPLSTRCSVVLMFVQPPASSASAATATVNERICLPPSRWRRDDIRVEQGKVNVLGVHRQFELNSHPKSLLHPVSDEKEALEFLLRNSPTGRVGSQLFPPGRDRRQGQSMAAAGDVGAAP